MNLHSCSQRLRGIFLLEKKPALKAARAPLTGTRRAGKERMGTLRALTGGVLARLAAEQGVTQGTKGTVPALVPCPAQGLAVLRAGAGAVLAAQSPGGHRWKAQPHRHVEVPQVTPAE